MTETGVSLPKIVSRDEWLAARRNLLAREKEATRARDALNSERRSLPMVEVVKPYTFESPQGKVTLQDLFAGRRQLIIYHFMFHPDWDAGCGRCSAWADQFLGEGHRKHLLSRDTSLVAVSRAQGSKLEAFKKEKGWDFPWYSSFGSDFNYDHHVTLDESVAPIIYNYRTAAEHEQAGTAYYVEGQQPIEVPGLSCFLRDGNRIFHTYSTYARGSEAVGGAGYFLDLTALGRQEAWEQTAARRISPDSGVNARTPH